MKPIFINSILQIRKLRHKKDQRSYICQRGGMGLEVNPWDCRALTPIQSLQKQSRGMWCVKDKSGQKGGLGASVLHLGKYT